MVFHKQQRSVSPHTAQHALHTAALYCAVVLMNFNSGMIHPKDSYEREREREKERVLG